MQKHAHFCHKAINDLSLKVFFSVRTDCIL